MKRIKLTLGKYAIVDDEDYEWLNQWKWYAHKSSNSFYARRDKFRSGRTKEIIFMHNFILKPPIGFISDHINADGLDNRRANLRICTPSQNACHRKKFGNRKFRGVYFKNNKWEAIIGINSKPVYIGRFDNEIDAAKAFDARALQLRGEFAVLNFPENYLDASEELEELKKENERLGEALDASLEKGSK